MDWIKEELASADLGDLRLTKRFGNVLHLLSQDGKKTIPAACNTWSETIAAYRFFDNKKVTPENILDPHIIETQKRSALEPVVLHVQDTSELNYSHRSEIETLGPLSREGEQGFHIHPTIAVTPERVCLGLVKNDYWVRKSLGEKAKRQSKPIKEKESFRWLASYRRSREVAQKLPNTRVVNVSDREGDIYDIFIEAEEARGNLKADWLIRASQNRRLEHDDEKLKEKVKSLPLMGRIEFELSGRNGRQKRTVKQEVRAGKVTLSAPKRQDGEFAPVEVNVVYCNESNAPKGATPVSWILMTSVAVESNEQALEVVKWYLCRWQVEVFFKILKTGCEVEELQLQDFNRIMNCLSLYMIIAWRTLYVTMLSRAQPEIRCDQLFSEGEWKSVHGISTKQKPPKQAPPLGSFTKMLGSLGGHLGRKHDGPPGPKAIWIGLQRMRDFALAWEMLQELPA